MTYANGILQNLMGSMGQQRPEVLQSLFQSLGALYPSANLQSTGGVVDQFGNFRPPVADYNTGLQYIDSSQGLLDRTGSFNPDVGNFMTGQNYINSSDGLLDAFGIMNPNVADYRQGLGYVEHSGGVLDRTGAMNPDMGRLRQLEAINNPYALAHSWTNPMNFNEMYQPAQSQYQSYQPQQFQAGTHTPNQITPEGYTPPTRGMGGITHPYSDPRSQPQLHERIQNLGYDSTDQQIENVYREHQPVNHREAVELARSGVGGQPMVRPGKEIIGINPQTSGATTLPIGMTTDAHDVINNIPKPGANAIPSITVDPELEQATRPTTPGRILPTLPKPSSERGTTTGTAPTGIDKIRVTSNRNKKKYFTGNNEWM